MVRKIDWLNHILEFFVVLIGILIAFQLNKCGTERERLGLIANHLVYLERETVFNQANLDKSLEKLENKLVAIDSLIGLVQEEADVKRINALAFQLLDYGAGYFQRNAYNTLVQSGDIRYIKNFKLKSAIVNIYEYYDWVLATDKIGLSSFTEEYYPYLRDNFDFVGGQVQPREIYFTQKFLNALGSYRFALNTRINKHKDCQKEIQNYLEHFN